MKLKIFILLLVAAYAKIFGQSDVIIKGKISGPADGYVVYLHNTETDTQDSAKIVDGTFTMTQKFTAPTRYLFYSSYDMIVNHGYRPFHVLIDSPCELTIETDIKTGFADAKYSGSKSHLLYDYFKRIETELHKKVEKALIPKYGEAFIAKPVYKDPRYKVYWAEWDSVLTELLTPEIEKFIRENPNSFASLIILNNNARRLDNPKNKLLFALLNPELKKLSTGKILSQVIEGKDKSALGQHVLDFQLPTPGGNKFSFSSLKGKYVLIDIWASWCMPCRAAFKELRPLYSKYKGKNFEILGISVDKDHDAWKKAMKDEKLEWLHVVDLEGEERISLKQFSASAIPKTFLVDPEGKIIGVDLESSELNKTLEKLIK